MIKNLVFDMGNVLIYFDRERFLDRAGITDPEDRNLLSREIYLSVEWARMDRGSLTPTEAEEIMRGRIPARLHPAVRGLVSEWARPILPVRGMAGLVRELKNSGYGIYLLSNAASDQHGYWPQIPGSESFDGTLISCDVGFVKPEKDVYASLCRRFSLVPDECVFIDDSPLNAEGAFRFGMHAIVFHDDVAELRSKLRDCGVNCSV